MKRRLLGSLLAVVVVFSLMPVAWAQATGGGLAPAANSAAVDRTLLRASGSAQVGDTVYETLDQAFAALNETNYSLTLMDETAWTESSIYWQAGTSSGYADSLRAAVEAASVVEGDAITLICKPDAEIADSSAHINVTKDITVYANGAKFGGDDLAIGAYAAPAKAPTTINIYCAKNLVVWGNPVAEREDIWNVNFVDCENDGWNLLMYRGSEDGKGKINLTLTRCKASGYQDSTIHTSADGSIKITGCTFEDNCAPVNIAHKQAGTMEVTIENSSFTRCGSTSTDNSLNQYAAPIRFVNNGSGTLTAVVNAVTITDTVGENGDILLGDGRTGKTSTYVSAAITGTNATVQVQYPGDWNNGTLNEAVAKTEVTASSGGTVSNAVAKIGEQGYAALTDALTAAQDGNTVTLMKEYDATSEGTITFDTGKAVTLDLGGHTLTLSRFDLEHGRLTVQNGNVVCTGQAFNVFAGSAPTDALHTKLVIADNVTINAAFGICLFPAPSGNAGYSSAIEVYGKIESGGIFVSGNLGNDDTAAAAMTASGKIPTIHIYDGAVVSNGTEEQGIAMNGLANVTVDGGTISGKEAIGVKRGTLTINGGAFTSNGEYVDPVEANNNGTENTGAAISITSTYNYAGTIGVTIKGGTFTSTNAPAVYLGHSKSGSDPKPYAEGVTLDIQGGTFASPDNVAPIFVSDPIAGDAAYTKEVITGGRFSQDLSESGYLDGSVQYQVTHTAGGFSYAKTLTLAQAAAQSGDTITDLKTTEANTVILTLRYDDGVTADVIYTVAKDASVPLPTPTRASHIFQGWYDASGNQAASPYTVAADATLTARWSYNGGGSGGSSITTYTVTVEKTDNGTLSVSPRNASKGTTVTLTVKPDEGCMLDSLTVTDKDGKPVDLTKVNDSKYTFKMPASKVTVKAVFKAEPQETLPFTDVAEDAWYYDAVTYVYEKGVMSGTNDGSTFSPAMNLTRGMMAQLLFNLEQGTAPAAGSFTDVAAGAWYADAVNWAAAKGIVGGYGNGKFGPEDSITREQMAVILYNYAKFKGEDLTASADLAAFSDSAQVSGWAEHAIKWAVSEELINGSNNALNPLGTASRAEVAQILMNYFSK